MTRFALYLGVPILALVAAGCGDDSGNTDNEFVDAAPRPDASETDASPSSATCGIVSSETAELPQGTWAVFSRADGSLIGTELFDAGKAAHRDDCVPGTMITAVLAMDGYRVLETFAGVNPGDTVVITSSEYSPTPSLTSLNVTTSDDVSALATAPASVSVRVPCKSATVQAGQTAVLGALDTPCVPADGTIDVLGIAYDDSSNVIGYAAVHDLALLEGTDPGDIPVTTAALGPWLAATGGTASVTATNPPPTATQARVGIEVGTEYQPYFRESVVGPANEPLTAHLDIVPAGFHDFVRTSVMMGGELASGNWITGIDRNQAYSEATAVDFGAGALPRIAQLLLTRSDPARPVVHWFADGDLDGTTGTVEVLLFGGGKGQWIYIGPAGGATSVQLPALPDGLKALAPQPGEVIQPYISFFWDSSWQSYHDTIANDGLADVLLMITRLLSSSPPLPLPNQDATLRYSLWLAVGR